jgi:glyoxylase-like metal-dependent hydrolase (beta-lactamase superfamily II)
MATPGHTPGGVVFYCEAEKVVFTGDTLFRMSMGRTDLEGGNWQDICHSLTKVIATLPHDTTAYCGHGPETTIGYEVRHNPCLR